MNECAEGIRFFGDAFLLGILMWSTTIIVAFGAAAVLVAAIKYALEELFGRK